MFIATGVLQCALMYIVSPNNRHPMISLCQAFEALNPLSHLTTHNSLKQQSCDLQLRNGRMSMAWLNALCLLMQVGSVPD